MNSEAIREGRLLVDIGAALSHKVGVFAWNSSQCGDGSPVR